MQKDQRRSYPKGEGGEPERCMKETLEMDNRVLLLMKKPSMLCERVAGNDWAQESSQHSVVKFTKKPITNTIQST